MERRYFEIIIPYKNDMRMKKGTGHTLDLAVKITFIILLNILYAQTTFAGEGVWTKISSMELDNLILVGNTFYGARYPMYNKYGGIYKSTDGGISWDTLVSLSESYSCGIRVYAHPTNPKILYYNYCHLYRSTNGGLNWQRIFNGPVNRLAINPKNPNIMYVSTFIPFGTMYKTTDGGATWNYCGYGLPNFEYFMPGPIAINPEYPDTIFIGTNDGLWRTTNGGNLWEPTSVLGFITGTAVHPLKTNIVFASTIYDWSTYKSTDYGFSWYKTLGSRGEFSHTFVFHPTDTNVIFNTENLKSTDGGKNWLKIDSTNIFSDIVINDKKPPTIYGANGSLGLYAYTDIITNINFTNKHFPETIKLFQNYPNPFNRSTTIQYQIDKSSKVILIIYNILGEEVRELINEYKSAGLYEATWDAKDNFGNELSSGVYFCILTAINLSDNSSRINTYVKKLILIK